MILQIVWPLINMVWPLNMRSHILLLNVIMFLLFITYLLFYLLFIIYICYIATLFKRSFVLEAEFGVFLLFWIFVDADVICALWTYLFYLMMIWILFMPQLLLLRSRTFWAIQLVLSSFPSEFHVLFCKLVEYVPNDVKQSAPNIKSTSLWGKA